jgi:hypothetical protein
MLRTTFRPSRPVATSDSNGFMTSSSRAAAESPCDRRLHPALGRCHAPHDEILLAYVGAQQRHLAFGIAGRTQPLRHGFGGGGDIPTESVVLISMSS